MAGRATGPWSGCTQPAIELPQPPHTTSSDPVHAPCGMTCVGSPPAGTGPSAMVRHVSVRGSYAAPSNTAGSPHNGPAPSSPHMSLVAGMPDHTSSSVPVHTATGAVRGVSGDAAISRHDPGDDAVMTVDLSTAVVGTSVGPVSVDGDVAVVVAGSPLDAGVTTVAVVVGSFVSTAESPSPQAVTSTRAATTTTARTVSPGRGRCDTETTRRVCHAQALDRLNTAARDATHTTDTPPRPSCAESPPRTRPCLIVGAACVRRQRVIRSRCSERWMGAMPSWSGTKG